MYKVPELAFCVHLHTRQFQFSVYLIDCSVVLMKTAKLADPEPKPWQDLLWSGKNSAVYYSPLFKRYCRLYCASERFINNKLRSRDHLLIICITEAPDCLINMKNEWCYAFILSGCHDGCQSCGYWTHMPNQMYCKYTLYFNCSYFKYEKFQSEVSHNCYINYAWSSNIPGAMLNII